MCDVIDWSQLTDLDEKLEWTRRESFDYRDIDGDWPYADSEDYYPEKNDFSHLISWVPPRKKPYPKSQPDYQQISADELQSHLSSEEYCYFYNLDENYQDIFPIKDLSKVKNKQCEVRVYAFPKKYILPTRSSFEEWYPYSVFFDYDATKKQGRYLDQFIFAKIINDNYYQNQNYCDDSNAEAKKYLEESYHDTLKSHAEHIQEMVYAEPSSNRRIFGIDAQSVFLKSAKEIHGECTFSAEQDDE